MPSADPAPTRRWPGYRDQLHTPQGWQDNPTPGHGPGSQGGGPGSLYTPTPRSRQATWLWTGVFALLLVLSVSGIVFGEDAFAVVMSSLATLVLLVLFGLAFVTMLANQSRRITWDGAGLADSNCIATRRIPWHAVHHFERENSAAARQRSHDEAPRSTLRSTGRGLRPRDIWVWIAKDEQGRPLLRLLEPDGDEAHAPFRLLHERIQHHLRLQGRAPATALQGDEGEGEDQGEDDESLSPADALEQAAMHEEMAAAIAAHEQRRRGIAGAMLAVVLVPLLLIAAYATWQAAWLQWLAPRAEGRVAEHIVTGKDKGLTQLVIAWRSADGREQQLKTSGTRGHSAYAVGSTMTVLYDPDDPQDASIDLFWEVWLWAVIAWGLLLLMGGAMALVSGATTAFARKPSPMPR